MDWSMGHVARRRIQVSWRVCLQAENHKEKNSPLSVSGEFFES